MLTAYELIGIERLRYSTIAISIVFLIIIMAAAAAAAAAELAALQQYLTVCGVNTPAKRQALMDGQGLGSINDFKAFQPDNVTDC